MHCRILVDLDLRALPRRPAEARVEMDLPLLLAHAGLPAQATALGATIDGRDIGAQYLPGSPGALLLALPEEVAARRGATVLLQAGPAAAPGAEGAAPRVVFSQGAESVEVLVGGGRFAVYRYNTEDPELPRPYFHPITGPTGVPITQEGEIPGTKQAHFHHTGLVLAHQNFTDGNNWQIGPNFSRMRHLGFRVMESGPLAGRFVQRLEWPGVKGDRVVFRETRTVTIPFRDPRRRVIDIDSSITCGEQPAVWNATPYHLLAIRVPDAMTVDRGGRITNSEGQVNPPGGTPARWLDFSGSLNGACGVALFNHPENLRHPTPWLNFENETVGAAPTYREPYAWQPAETRRFRFRVYVHAGDVRAADVAGEYAAWIAPVPARIGAPQPA